MTGPPMFPMRKAVAYRPAIRPRAPGGESLVSKAMAEMVNIVDPRPPRPRNTSSCQ